MGSVVTIIAIVIGSLNMNVVDPTIIEIGINPIERVYVGDMKVSPNAEATEGTGEAGALLAMNASNLVVHDLELDNLNRGPFIVDVRNSRFCNIIANDVSKFFRLIGTTKTVLENIGVNVVEGDRTPGLYIDGDSSENSINNFVLSGDDIGMRIKGDNNTYKNMTINNAKTAGIQLYGSGNSLKGINFGSEVPTGVAFYPDANDNTLEIVSMSPLEFSLTDAMYTIPVLFSLGEEENLIGNKITYSGNVEGLAFCTWLGENEEDIRATNDLLSICPIKPKVLITELVAEQFYLVEDKFVTDLYSYLTYVLGLYEYGGLNYQSNVDNTFKPWKNIFPDEARDFYSELRWINDYRLPMPAAK